MAYISLNYDQAHSLVEKHSKNGFFWEGYTLVKWTPNPNGYMQKNGMFRNNQWGFASKYQVTKNGTWEISEKLAKFI